MPRDAGSRHSTGASERPAAPGSTSSSWDRVRAGCSPSSDTNRSAWCPTRPPSEAPRHSVLRSLRASARCRPSASMPSRSVWALVTSNLTGQMPEVSRAVGSTSETAMSRVPRAGARGEVVAGETGNPSIEPRPRQRLRGGTTQRASTRNGEDCPRRPPDWEVEPRKDRRLGRMRQDGVATAGKDGLCADEAALSSRRAGRPRRVRSTRFRPRRP